MPVMRSPSASIRSASKSTNHLAVEPVPRPSFIPSSTNSSALSAAARLPSSAGGRLSVMALPFRFGGYLIAGRASHQRA